MAADDETDVVVALEDFERALQELVPSVSRTEMEHYRLVQARFAQGVDKDGEALTSEKSLSLTAQSSDLQNGPSHHNGELVLGSIAKKLEKGKGRVPMDMD